jgi:hypothetical protein
VARIGSLARIWSSAWTAMGADKATVRRATKAGITIEGRWSVNIVISFVDGLTRDWGLGSRGAFVT